jgi:NFU1 iron-sulfur cluster scaffold homolog, mitochondrial
MSERMITIYMEANPNPNSLKFVANRMLVPEGKSFDFPNAEATQNAPLAQQLFAEFDAIERVFYMSNFVTVTKNADIDWNEIKFEIRNHIQKYLQEGNEVIEAVALAEESPNEPLEGDSDTVQKIKDILEEYIRPAVEQDGGAISFHSYDEGRVKVLLQGSCSGCPSSTITLKAGIENLLKRMLPNEVNEVIAEGV